MPYNPGVQDIRGQLIAQGINSASNSVADAMRQYAQNKIVAQQAIGEVEGTIKANPDLLQFLNPENPDPNAPPASVKAFANLQKNGTLPLKDAATLSQFVRSYADTKKSQQAQALQQAQTAQAQAQTADIASQAKQRDLQNQLMQRQQALMEQAFSQQNPDATLNSDTAAPPASAFHAPTAPEPTRRAVFQSIIQSTGQFPKPETVDSAYSAAHDAWAKVERPLGFVAAGQEKDKEGKDVQLYYPVTIKNDGSIMKEKEPVRMYAGTPAPGVLLDGSTFTPIAQPAPQPPSAVAANISTEARKEITDSAEDLNSSVEALKRIRDLKSLNAQMSAKRSDALAAITGSAAGNALEAGLGDNSGQLFDSKVGALYGGIMKDAKNIRTQREFNAITAELPKSSQTSGTRADLLDAAEQKLTQHVQRLRAATTLMQKGVTPDSAWMQATPQDENKDKVADAPRQQMTPQIALQFLQKAGGDKDKARQLAKSAGYSF